MRAYVDSNILLRHLTGDPPGQAKRATGFLRDSEGLILVDVVIAEVVYVLESVYRVERARIAEFMRAILAFEPMIVDSPARVLRALELYDEHRIHFAESYLAACAEVTGVGVVASFDRDLDRVTTIRRLEPGSAEGS